MPLNPFDKKESPVPFTNRAVGDLMTTAGQGYSPSTGIHIYSELRPTERLRIAEDDDAARKFLRVIELYVHGALASARVQYGSGLLGRYHVRLFEVQANVLHLYLEAEKSTGSVLAALQFAFAFTKVVYEGIAADTQDSWNGFAICMDHGSAILVRHGVDCSGSLVSLGPSANRPAKRLLHGKTPAGTVEIPSEWAELIGLPKTIEPWIAINLRDREKLPFFSRLGLEEIEGILKGRVDEAYRQLANRKQRLHEVRATHQEIERGRFTPGKPYRTEAFVMTVDFENFSPLIEEAFKRGSHAIETLARGFYSLLEFGDFYERSTPGAIRLPWAGDRATFIFEPQADLAKMRGVEWIDWVERWQNFAATSDEGRKAQWGGIFPNVEWAVGIARGDDGRCVLAVIEGEDRSFLISAGWPVANSLVAQNLGKGGDSVIPNVDYEVLYPAPKMLFSKHPENAGFWRTRNIERQKVEKVAISAGARTASEQTFVEKAATIQVPSPRPWSR